MTWTCWRNMDLKKILNVLSKNVPGLKHLVQCHSSRVYLVLGSDSLSIEFLHSTIKPKSLTKFHLWTKSETKNPLNWHIPVAWLDTEVFTFYIPLVLDTTLLIKRKLFYHHQNQINILNFNENQFTYGHLCIKMSLCKSG